jgi:hypothetical protein
MLPHVTQHNGLRFVERWIFNHGTVSILKTTTNAQQRGALTIPRNKTKGPAEAVLATFLQEVYQPLHELIPFFVPWVLPELFDKQLYKSVMEVGRHIVQLRDDVF